MGNTASYPDRAKIKALEYLRTHIPVDEIINAGLRAEDELRAIEAQEEVAEGIVEETSPQTPPSDSEAQGEIENVPTGRLPKKPGSDSPYGISSFDRIRAKNLAIQAAKEKQLEEERKAREEELAKGNIGTLQTEQQKPRELSPRMKEWTAKATSDLKAPPELKTWERLLPAFVMCVLICLGALGFASMYNPPRHSSRLYPDTPPAAATVLGLIGINCAIYGLWRVPPCWALLNRYFLLIAATPRPMQLLGAMFSHQGLVHLAANMVTLWIFGTRLHDEIGRGNFLALYLASGAVGFMSSLANLVLRRGLHLVTMGASGGVYGVVAAYFWMHRFDEFKIFGYPPDPISAPQGLAFLGIILGMHILGLFSKKAHNIDMMSHMGGMAAGIVGIELAKKQMDDRARIRAERMKSSATLDGVVEMQRVVPPPAK